MEKQPIKIDFADRQNIADIIMEFTDNTFDPDEIQQIDTDALIDKIITYLNEIK